MLKSLTSTHIRTMAFTYHLKSYSQQLVLLTSQPLLKPQYRILNFELVLGLKIRLTSLYVLLTKFAVATQRALQDGVAEGDEPAALLGGGDGEGARHRLGLVGDDAHGPAADRGEGGGVG